MKKSILSMMFVFIFFTVVGTVAVSLLFFAGSSQRFSPSHSPASIDAAERELIVESQPDPEFDDEFLYTEEEFTEEEYLEEETSEEETTEEETTEEETTEEETTEEETTEEETTEEKSTQEKSTQEKSTQEKSTQEKSTQEKSTSEEYKSVNYLSAITNTKTAIPLRSEPKTDAELITMLAPGDEVYVLEVGKEWSKVKTDSAYSVQGYCLNQYLTLQETPKATGSSGN